VDAFTLDGLIAELRPLVAGRHVVRVRAAEAHAVVVEVGGARDLRLWLDAGRVAPGLYALGREDVRALQDEDALAGPSRQALLHLRKHLEGRRLTALRRVAGGRTVVFEAGDVVLVLRLSGVPAMTLAVDGEPLATLGEGAIAGPIPADAPDREWPRVPDAELAGAAAAARASGAPVARAVLQVAPGLGPVLARAVAEADPAGLGRWRDRLREPRPMLLGPEAPDAADAELSRADAVTVVPVEIERPGSRARLQPSWTAAAAAFLHARLRGHRFERARAARLAAAARETRRLGQLLGHLEHDLAGLPAAADLRRRAEALLAAGAEAGIAADGEVEVPDPYQPGARLRVPIDVRLALPANADRLFEKARRMDRARAEVERRIAETRGRLEAARGLEAALRAARDRAALEPLGAVLPSPPPAAPSRAEGGGTRHYLTSRGLSVLVGRGARENHRLTFAVARPEDVWLHARDVPGAHVIVRDPEGRASADDLREAAEVAAFFSAAARQPQVDVHVTRRKHVRPARGGAGRVRIGHSETLRVAPRDPEGRLRRR
jgi:hypothetical protein